ncbi:aminoglycoside 6-adenylyltransferase [Paenibacillus oenotherae]|uniref:Aminoglycoside 6-adenylyltransferase n=1 Tax=Paenibacillus oenotherae TaxID=1435645 RepID=A0ABS7D7H7_9BACL|nr:aminoglycoside 6-adenylyltransferase [Paenibacillus oenotherae]MBW7475482.1 aminoglycoside 6-adenylyltransferase [Paenibacillus oenotherae]
MRSEDEMMHLILNTANNDERIRAAVMNGSRVNPCVKKDIFQDYDIVYFVRDMSSFTSDHSWVDRFGERIMMQMPEAKVLPAPDGRGHFIYLMQFTDGNRMDLTLIPVEKKDELMKPDSLSVVLADKDGLLGVLPPATDRDYHIGIPSEQQFQDICNEFWWISMNISKGLWREELTYAMFMYEQVNRNALIQMMEWHIGIRTDFALSAGKFGKHMKDYLGQDEWDQFLATYPAADYERIWDSLFLMCDLFRRIALYVADHFQYEYSFEDDKRVRAHLSHVRRLPKDAREIY